MMEQHWTAEDDNAVKRMVEGGRPARGASVAQAAAMLDEAGPAATTAEAGWTLMRLGYRAMEFEKGTSECPSHCGCKNDASHKRWCTIYTAACDMRAAHSYLIAAPAYPLMLQELLGTPGKAMQVEHIRLTLG